MMISSTPRQNVFVYIIEERRSTFVVVVPADGGGPCLAVPEEIWQVFQRWVFEVLDDGVVTGLDDLVDCGTRRT